MIKYLREELPNEAPLLFYKNKSTADIVEEPGLAYRLVGPYTQLFKVFETPRIFRHDVTDCSLIYKMKRLQKLNFSFAFNSSHKPYLVKTFRYQLCCLHCEISLQTPWGVSFKLQRRYKISRKQIRS